MADGQKYLSRLLCLRGPVPEIGEVRDRTVLGDAFQVLPLLPPSCADLVIADPPYNLNKTYGKSSFSRMPKKDYEAFTRKWLSLVIPLMKSDASLYVCCDWESSLVIGSVLSEMLCVRNRITWQREKGRGAKTNWKNSMEDIWYATRSDNYVFHLDAVKQRRKVIAPYRIDGEPKDWSETKQGNFRDTCPSNFWDDITVPFWSMKENTGHPAQKPEKLLAKLILASSDPGDLILDPFLGSGSTSVAAKKLGRHYLGIESEEQYAMWAEERLEMADADSRIQGYEDGVFWERNSAGCIKKEAAKSVRGK